MLRTAFGVLGVLVALTGVLLLGAVGSGGVSPLNLAWAVAYVVAGVLVAAGGLVPRDRLGTVRPSKLIGAGILVFGLVNVLQGLQALLGPGADLFAVATNAALGVIFAVVGAEFVRGGRHFDLSRID